ncbi:YcxB family protein [Polluticaenibacter yanchengensis]|uniref:YcxB family protein n=1 Tax=Polluticaenibacter yanchengensis TaxID=3014562 RepID=A0ABT4ULN6_9BACT|nr:YcxB family protein [Chitinophagaceae bacterium LY-5]
MTIYFQLDQKDFLQHQLFIASKSPAVIKQRRKSWIFITLVLAGFSVFFKLTGNVLLFYYCLFFAVITLLFYPLYLRRHYRKHYEKYIAEHYKNRVGNTVSISFNDDNIETGDVSGNSRINHSEVENITEIKDYIFLKLKTIGYMVIPKGKIDDMKALKERLLALSVQLKVPYIEEQDWQWK